MIDIRAMWRRSSRTGAYALLLLSLPVALAAICWLAVRDPLSPLISAASRSDSRPLEARLAGFAFGHPPSTPRAVRSRAKLARVVASAEELRTRLDDAKTAAELHTAGVAALMVGEPEALALLRRAVGQQPDDARYWNDVAVALYTRARAEDHPHDLVEALANANQALRLDPRSPDALFNRALILSALQLRQQSASAWNAFLQIDGTSEWAVEARSRLESSRTSLRPSEAAHSFERPAAGNAAILAPLVQRDPERARRFGETAILGNWGRAHESGRAPEANAWLADARVIGAALQKRNGEALLADAVAAIDRCLDRDCAHALAEAHVRYDVARREYARREIAQALEGFRETARAFREARSPMAFVADYYAINCLEDLSDQAVSERLEQLAATVPKPYAALHAQIAWTIGATRARADRLASASDAYERALAEFMRLGERANTSMVRHALAAVQAVLGRSAAAWRLRIRAFDEYGDLGGAGEMQRALELAGRTEAIEGHWDVAGALFDLATDEPLRVNPRIHVSAMLWSALAAERGGAGQRARSQLAEARRYAATIPDATVREMALDDLALAEASVVLTTTPERSMAILDVYLASSRRRGRTFLTADAHVLRGRAARALGKLDDAERSYRAAIAAADEQRRDAFEHGIIDAYFSTATAAVDELTELLIARGRAVDAFAVLEAGRGRAVLQRFELTEAGGAHPVTPDRISDAVPPATVIVSYLVRQNETFAFTVSRRDRVRVTRVPEGRGELQSRIARLRAAIVEGRDHDANAAAELLHDALIAPLSIGGGVEALWIVDDPITHDLPFAVLRDRATRRRVAERFAVMKIPNASIFTKRSRERDESPRSVLAIGDPAFDRALFDDIPRLPAARREALAVARLYPGSTSWTGDEATADRFLEALGSARLLHVGAHAMASRHAPMESSILFAPKGERSGKVTAEEIVRASCAADLVVLTGCRTSVASETPSDIGTLAMAFVMAGAGNVVGTLWNIDDEDAAAFSHRFHDELIAGAAAPEAVRRAQVSLLATRPLRAWSGFTLTGTVHREKPPHVHP